MEKVRSLFRKLFVDHIFDFITLFLAITLGFFVDNFRDDQNNKSIARQLSGDMVIDIQKDTFTIEGLLRHAVLKAEKLEKLSLLLEDSVERFNDSMIYIYAACINHRPLFERQNSTFTLLINSGYFKDLDREVSIVLTEYNIDYEKTIYVLKEEQALLNEKIYPFLQRIFHTENFPLIIDNKKMEVRPLLHAWNEENRWLFHNYIEEIKVMNEKIIGHYQQLGLKARKTLRILNKN